MGVLVATRFRIAARVCACWRASGVPLHTCRGSDGGFKASGLVGRRGRRGVLQYAPTTRADGWVVRGRVVVSATRVRIAARVCACWRASGVPLHTCRGSDGGFKASGSAGVLHTIRSGLRGLASAGRRGRGRSGRGRAPGGGSRRRARRLRQGARRPACGWRGRCCCPSRSCSRGSGFRRRPA